ncbi:MAG: site-2 protease family protein [Acidimicrobiia bacterium]
MSAEWEQRLVFFGCLIVAVILHELSHGVTALFFGDDTAKREGRLTLNPVAHVDPFGTIILPAILVLGGLGAFGYAKPVPINPTKMRNPRRDSLYVSLAGPGSNFAMMAMAAVVARFALSDNALVRVYDPFSYLVVWESIGLVAQILLAFAFVNLLLGLFNLLPIPPLDGSSLIERVLPREWLPRWWQIRQYGMLVLIVLVFWTNLFGRILTPFWNLLHRFVVP